MNDYVRVAVGKGCCKTEEAAMIRLLELTMPNDIVSDEYSLRVSSFGLVHDA